MEAMIQTTEMTKGYGGQVAVNRANMTVGRGENYGFLGRNGAGKTTIRMLLGMVRPTSGEVCLFEQSLMMHLKQLLRDLAADLSCGLFLFDHCDRITLGLLGLYDLFSEGGY